MLSKILIGLAPNRKPCIKVTEQSSEDVRDELVISMREELNHISNTFSLSFYAGGTESDNRSYVIMPVGNEIEYFRGLIANKYLSDVKSQRPLLELAKFISEAYGGTLEMLEVKDN